MAARKKKESKTSSDKKTKEKVVLFTKQQILQSKKYSHKRDLINTLLEDKKTYSLQEVDELILKFMKGKVE